MSFLKLLLVPGQAGFSLPPLGTASDLIHHSGEERPRAAELLRQPPNHSGDCGGVVEK